MAAILSIPSGLFKLGEVKDTPDTSIQRLQAITHVGNTMRGAESKQNIDMVYTYADNAGVFMGAVPPSGTPTILMQGNGNSHLPFLFFPSDYTTLPKLSPGELLLKNSNNSKVFFDLVNYVHIGSDSKAFSINAKKEYNLTNNNLGNNFTFSETHRKIVAEIKRENIDTQGGIKDLSRLSNDKYYVDNLKYVGLDPTSSVGNSEFKNPIFVENREILYEFNESSYVLDLNTEASLYGENGLILPVDSSDINKDRRLSRADTLSLSLTAPNYLMESVKGTVVDVFGNILDLNRFPLPMGQNDLTLASGNKYENYLKIRKEQRRSLAFHFEINARKDVSIPDYNSNTNYGRDRSRFYVDIDKEGQFKINIPASSESGNIPLLTRYENYSTVVDKENPNKLIFTDSNIDIVHDSFAAGMVDYDLNFEKKSSVIKEEGGYNRGVITVKRKDNQISTPLERLVGENNANISQNSTAEQKAVHIRHGTAYHDVLATCITHQSDLLANFLYETIPNWDKIFPVKAIDNDIVKKEIVVGENAGGRSGSINLDGSIELNIGANTIDRQSIWLDTAGGMIANIGKDKNNISAALNMDGQLFLQLGGYGISKSMDSRFADNNNAFTSGVLDIRVLTEGNQAAIIRIDKNGINLICPNRIFIQANKSMIINSTSTLEINSSDLRLNGRFVRNAGMGVDIDI